MKNIFLIILTGIYSAFAFGQSSQQDFNIAEPNLKKLNKKKIWATQYYVHQLKSSGTIPFVLSDGTSTNLFADTCTFCDAALEGTASIKDSLGETIILNFAKVGEKEFVDCRKCIKYKKSKLSVENWGKVVWTKINGLGKGVNNYNLIPYRTIAVDKSIIPIGSVIYIPLAKGVKLKLANGTEIIHDGYFFAGDVGKAIIGNHIDIFTGLNINNPFPNVIYSAEDKTFEAYIIDDNQIILKLKKIHKK